MTIPNRCRMCGVLIEYDDRDLCLACIAAVERAEQEFEALRQYLEKAKKPGVTDAIPDNAGRERQPDLDG